MESAAFARFRKTKIHVNEFLWSSELSLALVQQKIITDQHLKERVATLFADLQLMPNCFIANNKAGKPKYEDPSRTGPGVIIPVRHYSFS